MTTAQDRPPTDETSPTEIFERVLDEVGRSIPAETLHLLLLGTRHDAEPSARKALALLGLRLVFVLDSSSLQRILRLSLIGGKSGVLDGMKAGFIRPVAPPLLDDEIREHASSIAKDCGVQVQQVLDLYSEIRPLIDFQGVSVEEVRRIRQEIADPDDADFVALFLQVESLGIITEDKGFGQLQGVRTFSVSDVGRIHLVYRKQAVILVCGLPVAALAAIAGKLLLAGVAELCAGAKRNPNIVLGVVAFLAGLGIVFPEERKKLVHQLRLAASGLGETWSRVQPWALACLQVSVTRAQQAALMSHSLGAALPPTARSGRLLHSVSRASSY